MNLARCFSNLSSRRIAFASPLRWSSTSSRNQFSTAVVFADHDDHIVEDVALANDGRFLDVKFSDETAYRFHSSWIMDSLPTRVGAETHRTSVAAVWDLPSTVANSVIIADDASILIDFAKDNGDRVGQETVNQAWLKAYAPFVAKPLTADSPSEQMTKGTSDMFADLMANRTPWTAAEMPEPPKFDAQRLLSGGIDYQIEFLENMIDPGVALIENVGPPDSYERSEVGKPLENLVFEVIAKINAHPVRNIRFGVIKKKEVYNQGKDYNVSDPLSMHTDHSFYHGTPGYLQFMYQAEGSVMSKVADGIAVAARLKANNPKHYDILKTVEFNHSIRNVIYQKDGMSRDLTDPTQSAYPFELIHAHPIINEDENGVIQQIIQSESKRGVCAFEFDKYDEILDAYSAWLKLCESPEFVSSFHWPEHTMLVCNNYRILHGRASVPPGTARTMCFGYTNQQNTNNRYRFLKMQQTGRDSPELDESWLLRSPNQVLKDLVV